MTAIALLVGLALCLWLNARAAGRRGERRRRERHAAALRRAIAAKDDAP